MKRLLSFFLLSFSILGFAQVEEEVNVNENVNEEVFPIFSNTMLLGPREFINEEPELELMPIQFFTKERAPEVKTCRAAIVDGYKVLGLEIDPQSFSTKKFEDFNISAEEFNLLDSDEQLAVYEQIMPLDLMLQKAKNALDSELQNNFFELISSPIGFKKFNEIKTAQEELEICKAEEIVVEN